MPLIRRRWFLAGALALAAPGAAARNAPPTDAIPTDQSNLQTVIARFSFLAAAEKDANRREELLSARGAALRASLNATMTFERWVCSVAHVHDMGTQVSVLLNILDAHPLAGGSMSNLPTRAIGDPKALQPQAELDRLRLFVQDEAFLVSGAFHPDARRGLATSASYFTPMDPREFKRPDFLVTFSDVQQPDWLKEVSARSRR